MLQHTRKYKKMNYHYPSGYLEMFLGPMFSGKTTHLIQLYKMHKYIGKKVVVINYSGDTRYGNNNMLSSHDQIMIPCIMLNTLGELWNNLDNPNYTMVRDADVIIINEGQFFEDLYDIVIQMVDIANKTVYISGLDGDFQRNKFGRILDLIPYCDKITKLQSMCALCKNGMSGIFSHRISNEQHQIVIGSDNYMPLCRECYLHETNICRKHNINVV
jgi:thymidine kinase